MRWIDELCRKGALEQNTAAQSIFIVGVANLVAGEADGERLRRLLSALETKQRLIELLDAYADARQQSVRVVVGLEETIPEMRNLVLIGAPARLGAQSLGTVAVIGSTGVASQETINASVFYHQAFRPHLTDAIESLSLGANPRASALLVCIVVDAPASSYAKGCLFDSLWHVKSPTNHNRIAIRSQSPSTGLPRRQPRSAAEKRNCRARWITP